jgi:hypothetical protein
MILIGSELVEASAEFLANLPTAPPDPAPRSVTRFQARSVLRRALLPDGRTLFEAITAQLEASAAAVAVLPPTDEQRLATEDAVDAWANAQTFERTSQLVQTIAAGFGLTDEEVDAMFRQAAAVTA